MSLSGHQSAKAKTTDWLTPPEILRKLGRFDLDPACPLRMPWKTATKQLTKKDDGLKTPWRGRVWLNPPFTNKQAYAFMAKMAAHNNGIALIPARTETKIFFDHVWPKASSILFLYQRPYFFKPNGIQAKGNCGAPIVLIAYGGGENDRVLRDSGMGKWMQL